MGTAYTKTSPTNFVDGETIQASDFTTEFDAIDATFETGGHQHDGTDGEGGAIEKLLSNAITFGTGVDTDIAVTFNANTADGVLTWMEDEDYFQFSDDILLTTTEKVQFRDTAIYINSSTDGQLDLVADTEIQIAATTVDINGAVSVSGVSTHGDDIVSDTDSTDDLGTTSVRWANLFVDGITATDQITATGFTGTLDGILGSGAAAAASVTTLTTSGIASIDDTTDTTSGTTGSIHTDGGVGVAKALYVGTTSKLIGVTTHGGNVVSDTDSTDDLGTTSVRWANLFVDAITATDQITATGFTGTLDGILGSGTPAAATVTTIDASGVATATTFEPDGDTSASDNAAIGYTSAEGLILTGQGSTNDVTIKNDADADVITIATGATNVDVVGDLTAATLNADGDTSAGDNAAMGYTSAEGLILTGQGSTNDVTIKNDADADVITIPTGTTSAVFAGNMRMTKGGDIASASPLVIDTDGNYFDVTGTTNFAAMTVAAGNFFMLQFDGALTITHGSGIEIPGAANLTTATGDRLICYATAANTVEVMNVATEAASAASGDLVASNNLSDVASAATSFGNIKQAASSSATGVIEIATDAETNTGTATDRAITPANLTQRAMLQGLHSMWIAAGSMIPQITNGPSSGLFESSSNDIMSRSLDFNKDTDELAQFTVVMPKSWDEGTVTFRAYWTAASGSGTVLWSYAGGAFANSLALDTALGSEAVTAADTLITALDVHISATSAACTIANSPAAGDLAIIRVRRDISGDNLSADAKLLGVQMFYTTDAGNDA